MSTMDSPISPETVEVFIPPSKMFLIATGLLTVAILAYMIFNEYRSEKVVKTVTEMRQREEERGQTPPVSMNGHRPGHAPAPSINTDELSGN